MITSNIYIDLDQSIDQQRQPSFAKNWSIRKQPKEILHGMFVQIGLSGNVRIIAVETAQTDLSTERTHLQN